MLTPDRKSPLLIEMRPTANSGSAQPCLTNGVRLQIDPVTGKSVLLHPEGIIELNETARAILSCCDGRTLDEIVHALAEEYEADPESLAADVRETLADLHQRRLIDYA